MSTGCRAKGKFPGRGGRGKGGSSKGVCGPGTLNQVKEGKELGCTGVYEKAKHSRAFLGWREGLLVLYIRVLWRLK